MAGKLLGSWFPCRRPPRKGSAAGQLPQPQHPFGGTCHLDTRVLVRGKCDKCRAQWGGRVSGKELVVLAVVGARCPEMAWGPGGFQAAQELLFAPLGMARSLRLPALMFTGHVQ